MRLDRVTQTRRRTLALQSLAAALLLALAAPDAPAATGTYRVRKLVSDVAGSAEKTDSHLVNGWGIAFGPGPAWIADNGTDVSTVYDGNGKILPLVVTIPKGAPTGIVFNATPGFVVDKGPQHGASLFLFASEAGVVSGWSPAADPSHAIAGFTAKDGAIYKGLALVVRGTHPLLYATDFHNGKIDVLNDRFRAATVAGKFADPNIPKGYAPFGIRAIDGKLIVTFAKQDANREDDVHGQGLGFVDVFDAQGQLLRRLVTRGRLNAPWGLALAPAAFGPLGGDLLVGNFGDGTINAYDPKTGNFRGSLLHNGKPIVIDGLWGLSFGNGIATQPKDTLFFAAGPADEKHGLFGRIDVAY